MRSDGRIGAGMAKAVMKALEKATPGSKSIRREGRTCWRRIRVDFDHGCVREASALLAARCASYGATRYLHMGALQQPLAGALVVMATSPKASVRLVEQYDISLGLSLYSMDVLCLR